ncbi:MAG: hypothetical protein KME07_04495 [Pegethrix bostrychoides GSE-TBD4-15B]|jgi:hypothetical protein|uniref:Uncharacterized protein n=1 Tax=Pegethrix bostrychoides GSE-TBD4-15B TaxID=2839662 RepID=A0A951U3H9_9CYAN|nr:hypothetical protein [Pegethrix bostrychoides GSE-TBD4-15B]
MVSIVSSEEFLLGDAKKMLLKELSSLSGKRNLEEAFAAWLLGNSEIPFRLSDTVSEVAKYTGGQRRYYNIAILGFAAACDILKESELIDLSQGLSWVSRREPLLEDHLQVFCTDVVALLGIVLGAKIIGDETIISQVREWLNNFIEKSFQARLDGWQKCLLVSVCQLGGLSVQKSVPPENNLADVRIALYSKNALTYATPSEEDDKREALFLMKHNSETSISISRIILRLAAFNYISRLMPSTSLIKPSVEDVSKVLHRIPAAFRRWTWESKSRTGRGEAIKWHIENEYHVQNLLYFLLSPIFPDLKDEDYTPSVGQMHPRVDLAILSLSLIIEVKFMRASDKPQDMIEQIAADSSVYLVNGSVYRHIIAFIWDDSNKSHEHDTMRNGLRQLPGIIDAVIMSRPGNLTRQSS